KRIAEIEKRKAELRNRAESEGWGYRRADSAGFELYSPPDKLAAVTTMSPSKY
ncbi:MAG: hypothetical protein HC836_49465, partial [Richelia sp. RM2_1_2]|nr:hypothetical protein [Richelia sp. RM2_1_2]